MSVWQTPQASSLTSTSPFRGSARSSSVTWSGCSNSSSTAARILTERMIPCPSAPLGPWRAFQGELLVGLDHVHHSVDQREVRERLREVAEVAPGRRIDFLRIQPQGA